VVKEDGWALFGFDRPAERLVFQRLLSASGFGPRLLALLSTLGADAPCGYPAEGHRGSSTVSGIGKKKAERLVLELHDRFEEVGAMPPASMGPSERRWPPSRGSVILPRRPRARCATRWPPTAPRHAQLIKQALQRLAGKR
jgi:Holliday junction DNA helicase RuvA